MKNWHQAIKEAAKHQRCDELQARERQQARQASHILREMKPWYRHEETTEELAKIWAEGRLIVYMNGELFLKDDFMEEGFPVKDGNRHPEAPVSDLAQDIDHYTSRLAFLFPSAEAMEHRIGDICEEAQGRILERWGEAHARRWIRWQFICLAYARLAELVRQHTPLGRFFDALMTRLTK